MPVKGACRVRDGPVLHASDADSGIKTGIPDGNGSESAPADLFAAGHDAASEPGVHHRDDCGVLIRFADNADIQVISAVDIRQHVMKDRTPAVGDEALPLQFPQADAFSSREAMSGRNQKDKIRGI